MLRFVAGLFALLLANVCLADENPPLLLRHPTVSATQIVFVYGGDLWSVAKEGGTAQRLTAANGAASRPVFSPDGRDRKSTRLNSSHGSSSYAVFCLKKITRSRPPPSRPASCPRRRGSSGPSCRSPRPNSPPPSRRR